MAKDFSSVTTHGGNGKKAVTANSAPPPWRNPKVLGAVLAVIVVVGGLSWLFWPTADSGPVQQKTTVGAPHGPRSISGGIPSGYTQDQGGAGAAASNFVQAMTLANSGGADVKTIRGELVIANPDGVLAQVLDSAQGSTRKPGQVTRQQPVSVSVGSFTQKEATVTVLTVSMLLFNPQQQAAKDGKAAPDSNVQITTVWGTTRLGLVWDGDKSTWLVRNYQFSQGPTPEKLADGVPASDPLVAGIQEGNYTLVVN